jgi:hypothetical protein
LRSRAVQRDDSRNCEQQPGTASNSNAHCEATRWRAKMRTDCTAALCREWDSGGGKSQDRVTPSGASFTLTPRR